MQLRVRTGTTNYTYTDVELAAGQVSIDQRLTSDAGIEQVENGDLTLEVYGSFLGFDTLGALLDGADDADTLSGYAYLRAQVVGDHTVEGNIYTGDLLYDEITDVWTVTVQDDAQNEMRDRLRRTSLDDAVKTTLQAEPVVVHTAGAPVHTKGPEGQSYQGTVKHAGSRPDQEIDIESESAGWQSVGLVWAWPVDDLLGQALREQSLGSELYVSDEHTSAHATTPTTGSVPPVPQPEYTYQNQDGTTTDVPVPGDRYLFQIRKWDKQYSEDPIQQRIDLSVPDWTGEQVLDHYLKITGRRVIAEYRPFPSRRIELVFVDSTTDVQGQSIETPVPAEGIAPGESRLQNFYEAELLDPRLSDLAVEQGAVFENSISAGGAWRVHYDVRQNGMHAVQTKNQTQFPADRQNFDYTSWHPDQINSQQTAARFPIGFDSPRDAWYYNPYNPDTDPEADKLPDMFSAWPAPIPFKYAARRFALGPETKIVERNESSVRIDVNLPQMLLPHTLEGAGRLRGQNSQAQGYWGEAFRDPRYEDGTTASDVVGRHVHVDTLTTGDTYPYKIETASNAGGDLYDIAAGDPYTVHYVYGWPVIPYDDDTVHAVCINPERDGLETPNTLAWIDMRGPNDTVWTGNAGEIEELKYGFSAQSQAYPIYAKQGVSVNTNDRGTGVEHPLAARHIYTRHEAARARRIEAVVRVDTSTLDYKVGDTRRGIDWRGYTWEVVEEKKELDRPVAELTLQRYIEPSNDLFNWSDINPGKPADLTATFNADQDVGNGLTTSGYTVVTWAPPDTEYKAGIWYYELQRYSNPKESGEGFWLRKTITTGTEVVFPDDAPTITTGYRVRAVGWPVEQEMEVPGTYETDEDGNEEYIPAFTTGVAPTYSDWVYAQQRS